MDLVRAWFEAAAARLPIDVAVWDAHTHTGQHDPDGVRGSAEDLLEALNGAGHAGAVVMTNRDLGGYPGPNDRILAEANAADGRLLPFLRVDPRLGVDALDEAARSLDAGHRGLKLHPRGEEFELNHPTVRRLAWFAAERAVPILIHAGRGVPSLGHDAARLCDEVDGLRLILAHAAISDLSWLGPRADEHPGLHFDTAWWDVTDLLALFAWVPPGRIVYASDTPYGHPELAFVLAMRAAISAGYDARRMRAVFGQNLLNLVGGRPTDDLGAAPGDGFMAPDAGLTRVHANLHGAAVAALTGHDPSEQLSLARLGCVVPPDVRNAELHHAIAATLDHIDLELSSRSTVVRHLIVAAAAALTPAAGAPILHAG